ncbi:MAG: YfhO family protein [Lachnospiraceae bacterium]
MKSGAEKRNMNISAAGIVILLVMVSLTCALVFRNFLFGEEYFIFDDIGSDTAQQYIAQYASIIDHIRSGDFSLWNFDYGFGAGMYVLNLFNPVLMILYFIVSITGVEALPSLMIYVFVSEIVLSSAACYLYLSVFGFREYAKTAASFLYAFNGFMIVWGQHYQFGIICVLLPLLLLGIERYIKDNKSWRFLTVISAVVTLNSMYIAYMMFLFSAFYVAVRYLMRGGLTFRQFWERTLKTALDMILGLGIGAVSLLPSAANIFLVSSRVSSGRSLISRLIEGLKPYDMLYYKTLISRLFSSTINGINGEYTGYLNYYEGPHIYFGSIFFILAVVYIFSIHRQKTSRRSKIFQYAIAAVCIIMLVLPAFGTIFNGFVAPFSRYMFLVMPYFAFISASALNNIFEGHLSGSRTAAVMIIVSGIITEAVYGLYFFFQSIGGKKYLLASMAAVCVFTVVLLIQVIKKSNKSKRGRAGKICAAILSVFIVLNIAAETDSSFSNRVTISKGSEYAEMMFDEDTDAALDYLKESDKGLYRVEKTYGATVCMDSMIQGYPSVSSYNSTQNGNIISYVNNCWPELIYADQNHYAYRYSDMNREKSDLAGVKYILDKGEGDTRGLVLVKSIGAIDIYRSEGTEGIASFFRSSDGGFYPGNKVPDAKISYNVRSDGDIEIFVDAPCDGILYAAIPYENGWCAAIDGSLTNISRVNEGFQGVRLAAGEHVVRLTYKCPLFAAGAVVSAVSLVLFVILAIVFRKKKG